MRLHVSGFAFYASGYWHCAYLKKRGSSLMLFSSFHFLRTLCRSSMRCLPEVAITKFPSSRCLRDPNIRWSSKEQQQQHMHLKNSSVQSFCEAEHFNHQLPDELLRIILFWENQRHVMLHWVEAEDVMPYL